jgi:hypothetical protein
MLYTPLAFEDVFREPDTAPTCRWRTIAGRLLLVRTDPDGLDRVERLVSTDPADYLRTEWMPGQLVD